MEHLLEHFIGEIMGFEAQFLEAGVFWVVIVLFGLGPGIFEVLYFHLVAQFPSNALDPARQLPYGKGLGDLVEDAKLPGLRGMEGCQIDALHGVHEVDVAPGLPPFPVDGQRITCHRLDHEAVDHRTEDLVVIEVGQKPLLEPGFLRVDPVDRPLHEVGHPQAPGAHVKPEEIRVLDLGGVVEGARLPWEEEPIPAALVLYFDPAFLDVDVGRAVFAHGPKLDDVTGRADLLHGVGHVQGGEEVVLQGKGGPIPVDHGVGGRGLLGVVDHYLGLIPREDLLQEAIVRYIPDVDHDLAPGPFLPELGPLVQVGRAVEGLAVQLQAGPPAKVVVHPNDLVIPLREIYTSRPAQVAVSTQDQDTHPNLLPLVRRFDAVGDNPAAPPDSKGVRWPRRRPSPLAG